MPRTVSAACSWLCLGVSDAEALWPDPPWDTEPPTLLAPQGPWGEGRAQQVSALPDPPAPFCACDPSLSLLCHHPPCAPTNLLEDAPIDPRAQDEHMLQTFTLK